MSGPIGIKAFDAEKFSNEQIAEIRKVLGDEKAIIACSGGVDSTVCAALTHRAIGENLIAVFLDTGFMRLKEPEKVVKLLSSPPLGLSIKLVDVRKRFMKALEGLVDAEEKRKAFRETFYKIFGETARKEGCRFLVQGTIAPDWIETKGGIKTQHNVLTQIGINPVEKYGFKVIEPLAYLYKDQVRQVARYLEVSSEISERQPFPGPGLSVRVVGLVRPQKLDSLKKATAIVEKALASAGFEQYFVAVIDSTVERNTVGSEMRETASKFFEIPASNIQINVLKSLATGVKGDIRSYGKMAVLTIRDKSKKIYKPPIETLTKLQVRLMSDNPQFTHILYSVTEKPRKKPYIAAVRAIKTRDFMTAEVAPISWGSLTKISNQIIKKCSNIATVCYDVTPKPPATVEFE